VRLVDQRGSDMPENTIWEMLVNSPSLAPGKHAVSRGKAFEGGWARSFEKYERQSGSRDLYGGRTDELFKVSGMSGSRPSKSNRR
jgi:hypothetical protein